MQQLELPGNHSDGEKETNRDDECIQQNHRSRMYIPLAASSLVNFSHRGYEHFYNRRKKAIWSTIKIGIQLHIWILKKVE